MTAPRAIYTGAFYVITRRCSQRQYLLRPDRATKNIVLYCIAVAAQKYGVQVIDVIHMSNHLHVVVYDPNGNVPEFYGYYHSMIARCVNALRGRSQHFFDGSKTSLVRLEDRPALIDKLVYVSTNPISSGLVASTHEWPGARGSEALQHGTLLVAKRPAQFFADDGDMPEEATLACRLPDVIDDPKELLATVRDRVAALQQAEAKARAARGTRALGRYAVLRQPWRGSPSTPTTHRRLSPQIATRDVSRRLFAMHRRCEFLRDYREARRALLAGRPALFPVGTYWLARRMRVHVAPAIANSN